MADRNRHTDKEKDMNIDEDIDRQTLGYIETDGD